MEQAYVKKDQAFILNKAIKYLELKKSWTQEDFDRLGIYEIDIDNINEKIVKFKKGFCFGFIIKDFAKRGKHLEEYYSLSYIIEWDETKDSLALKTQLSEDDPDETVEDLFEDFINNIWVSQAADQSISAFQNEYIKPPLSDNQDEPLRFEVITDSGEKKFFKNHVVIAGNFSQAELEKIWPTKSQAANDLVQISIAGCHSIRISYLPGEKCWRLYDPNNDHSLRKCGLFVYSKVDKIIPLLPISLRGDFENYVWSGSWLFYFRPGKKMPSKIMRLRKDQKEDFLQLFNDLSEGDYKELGYLRLMGIKRITGHQYCVGGNFYENKLQCILEVLNILNKMVANKEELKSIAIKISSYEEKIIPIKNLQLVKIIDNCGLHEITRQLDIVDSEEKIIQIIDLAKSDEAVLKTLSDALSRKTVFGNALLKAIMFNPKLISTLLDLARYHPVIIEGISKALPVQDNEQWTVLHYMMDSSFRQLFKSLLTLASDNPMLMESLVKALQVKDMYNLMALHRIPVNFPNGLDILLEAAEKHLQIKKALIQSLSEQVEDLSLLMLIAIFYPEKLQFMLEKFQHNRDFIAQIGKVLVQQVRLELDKNKKTAFVLMVNNYKKELEFLIKIAKMNLELVDAIAGALVIKDAEDMTGLHHLGLYFPQALVDLFDLAFDSDKLLNALVKAMKVKDNKKWTGLDALISTGDSLTIKKMIAILAKDKNHLLKFGQNWEFIVMPSKTVKQVHFIQWLTYYQNKILFYLQVKLKFLEQNGCSDKTITNSRGQDINILEKLIVNISVLDVSQMTIKDFHEKIHEYINPYLQSGRANYSRSLTFFSGGSTNEEMFKIILDSVDQSFGEEAQNRLAINMTKEEVKQQVGDNIVEDKNKSVARNEF